MHAKAACQLGGFKNKGFQIPLGANNAGFLWVFRSLNSSESVETDHKTLKPQEFRRQFVLFTGNTSTKILKKHIPVLLIVDFLKHPSRKTKVLSGTMKATKLRHLNANEHHISTMGHGDWEMGWGWLGFC